MSNPFHRLTHENKEQVIKYLKFFRAKKDSILRALGNEFEDTKADRLSEDMFSREDMEEFSDFLQHQCQSQITQDISVLINMSALAINALLESAQEQGAIVELDTTALENQGLLDSIERMSMEMVPAQRKTTSLVSLKDEAKAMKDESKAVKDEADRMANSNKMLQQRFSTVQEDATNLAREKKELQREIDSLKRRLETAERSAQNFERTGKGSQDDASNANRKIRELEEDLEEERRNNATRVSETPQFIQMRKMMQSQNTKLRDLRRRLDKYEPDDSKEDDDDR